MRAPGAIAPSNATSTGLPPSGLAARIIPFDSIPISFAGLRLNTTPTVLPIARRFHEMGFRVIATEGTRNYLRTRGVPAELVRKAHEGRPNAIDLIVSGDVHLLINTPLGKFTQADDYAIRRAAVMHRVPYTTTMSAASAAAIAARSDGWSTGVEMERLITSAPASTAA